MRKVSSNHDPHESDPKRHLIGSPVFVQLIRVPNTQTDTQTTLRATSVATSLCYASYERKLKIRNRTKWCLCMQGTAMGMIDWLAMNETAVDVAYTAVVSEKFNCDRAVRDNDVVTSIEVWFSLSQLTVTACHICLIQLIKCRSSLYVTSVVIDGRRLWMIVLFYVHRPQRHDSLNCTHLSSSSANVRQLGLLG